MVTSSLKILSRTLQKISMELGGETHLSTRNAAVGVPTQDAVVFATRQQQIWVTLAPRHRQNPSVNNQPNREIYFRKCDLGVVDHGAVFQPCITMHARWSYHR